LTIGRFGVGFHSSFSPRRLPLLLPLPLMCDMLLL
jgi:hypothetical protein